VIGTRTLASLTLLGVVVAAAFVLGSFAPDRLAARGFETLVLVGGFGVVVGTLVFRFWRFGDKSGHYFRWTSEPAEWGVSEGHFLGGARHRIVIGDNVDGEALDFSPRARHALSVLTASVLALAAIGSSALDQLEHAFARASSATSSFCPPEETESEVASGPDPNQPGCELVRRAYALGYAKSLGDCAPKAEKTGGVAGHLVCTRRQLDEPILHYWWRLLSGFFTKLRSSTGPGYFKQTYGDFRARLGHFGSLRRAESEMLASAPHASHHLWTNLPDPADGAFDPVTCSSRYLHLAHRPDPPVGPARASRVFEHVVAQLLFETTYDDPAGHCREYHVHWGAPLDACEQLAADPGAFLAKTGALDDVKKTLERYRVEGDLDSPEAKAKLPDPSLFVSFGCYMEQEAQPRTSTPVSFGGLHVTADRVAVAPSAPDDTIYVDRYDAVARLLAKGFHYGVFGSRVGLEQGAAEGLEGAFASADFLLTRTYELDSIDIYLDPGWLAKRPDLLEVYPYDIHLKNYVDNFRRQYRRQRGRL
jgi:hypothetical protein